MTREELAKELDCSASAIVHWEGGKREIPSWVADKIFSKLPITFTVQELAELYDLCREEAMSMSELIQDAVRLRIEERRAAKTPLATKFTQFPTRLPSSKVPEDPREQHRAKDGTND
jgi:transcriptional regulator with XRE-family HTH domain